MNCKTRTEKFNELMAEVKRAFLITVITVIGTAIFAMALALAITVNENKHLKETIVTMEREMAKEEESYTTYKVVIDEKSGHLIYAGY